MISEHLGPAASVKRHHATIETVVWIFSTCSRPGAMQPLLTCKHTSVLQGSKFGMAFERAARATNATARHDQFDSSIIEVLHSTR